MCAMYFWAVGFSPHRCHLQICSVNVFTNPGNQVKSPREDQRVAIKYYHVDAFWKLSEHINKRAKFQTEFSPHQPLDC